MSRNREEILEIVHRLHRVPHLRLPLEIDLEGVRREVLELEKSQAPWPYHSYADFRKMSEAEMRRYSKGYSGLSLYEFNGDSHYLTDNYEIYDTPHGLNGVERDSETNQVLFKPTKALEKSPLTSRTLDSICERKGRTRFIRSEPNHAIVWHSHNRGPWFADFMIEAIVHIPIFTDPRVLHVVRDYRNPRSETDRFQRSSFEQVTSDPDCYVQNYGAGECWLFNSWHDHYYHNYSQTVRYTILMYIDWFHNNAFVNRVEEALNQYRGPLLAP